MVSRSAARYKGDLPRSMSIQIDAIASALLGKWLKVRCRCLCLETLGNSSRAIKRAPGRCNMVHLVATLTRPKADPERGERADDFTFGIGAAVRPVVPKRAAVFASTACWSSLPTARHART